MKSTIYLLCGLPGTGKTTYAKRLEKKGIKRYSLDEMVFRTYGRNFLAEDYPMYERRAKSTLTKLALDDAARGFSVALDFGFWTKAERAHYQRLVKRHGAEAKLLYFTAKKTELWRRIKRRNAHRRVDDHVITKKLFDEFITRFEQPLGENVEMIST